MCVQLIFCLVILLYSILFTSYTYFILQYAFFLFPCSIFFPQYEWLPSTVFGLQVYSNTTSSSPFIALNENKLMTLSPMSLLQKEAPDPSNSTLLTEASHASIENEFPLENWVHVGCGVRF